MLELYNYNINDSELKELININKEIISLTEYEIKELLDILVYINCNEKQIKNIILCNPFYLSRIKEDVEDLINKLKEYSFNELNLLFESNPLLLNKNDFEIEDYIKNRLKEDISLEKVIEEIENNPFIIDEIEV